MACPVKECHFIDKSVLKFENINTNIIIRTTQFHKGVLNFDSTSINIGTSPQMLSILLPGLHIIHIHNIIMTMRGYMRGYMSPPISKYIREHPRIPRPINLIICAYHRIPNPSPILPKINQRAIHILVIGKERFKIKHFLWPYPGKIHKSSLTEVIKLNRLHTAAGHMISPPCLHLEQFGTRRCIDFKRSRKINRVFGCIFGQRVDADAVKVTVKIHKSPHNNRRCVYIGVIID
mmetsp:Transcript_32030/g.38226  ORF Transcript_32030/g.38226 Transcript_32030/m.38226 type:complete len:234 (-) Transcript_32030:195-896(-)